MSTEINKTNESKKFSYYFTDKFNLKNVSLNITLVNLSIYHKWKNIKSGYNNNKPRISAPIWNDDFDLPDRSYSVSDM